MLHDIIIRPFEDWGVMLCTLLPSDAALLPLMCTLAPPASHIAPSCYHLGYMNHGAAGCREDNVGGTC